jgi:formylglycine-generating enzyme required for sulfatase activity
LASIFISYRRADSAGLAGRLYDRLERHFRRNELFIDIDSIQAGSDFTQALERTLSVSRIVLVLIGPQWLDIRNDKGERRLDDPEDFVRMEIEASLARDVSVVPVLLEDAVMPAASALPESMRPLVRRQAIELRTRRFGPDCDDLVRTLKALLKPARRTAFAWPALAASLALAAGGIGYAAFTDIGPFAKPKGLSENREQIRPAPGDASARSDLASPGPTLAVTRGQTAGLPQLEASSQAAPDAATRERAAAEQARLAAEVKAIEDRKLAAEAKAAEEARKIAESKAVDDARIMAEAQRVQVASLSLPRPPAEAPIAKAPGPAGTPFQECETCPRMVALPAGRFTMGSPAGERGRNPDEGPQREVTIATPFAVSRYPVSFDEWDACLAEGGCNAHKPGDYDWGRGRNPVIFVSWQDAKAYATWLSQKTGQSYRLLTEAEWEYAARACTSPSCAGQPFWFGPITPDKANYDWRQSYDGSPKAQPPRRTVTIDQGTPNGFGLVQMLGNVRHWTEDCWAESYAGMPGDVAARTGGDCSRRITRGGSWADEPKALRAAARGWEVADQRGRSAQIGIRVARTIAP